MARSENATYCFRPVGRRQESFGIETVLAIVVALRNNRGKCPIGSHACARSFLLTDFESEQT
ncbi:hypothetical protein RISK_002273 [Rhodopirellula islandica]|uniref:Uncharacterized protein n=1 Tax=Rhodopirellula islandica TaxID=595434 RepID=A0A0J1BGJ3_RHOIS|nr:hypothetical protein RISK_002273 [Rhodopirellula islandica]